MDWTIVVMAYNEEAGLAQTVRETLDALRAMRLHAEILIVDDGSTDATAAIADQLASAAALGGPTAPIRAIHHRPNRGLGQVYRTGFEAARGQWITFMPADGELPPENLRHLWHSTRDADLVLGTIQRGRQPLTARAASMAERLLLDALFGPLPEFQGLFAIRRSLLDSLALSSEGRGWTIVMEMLIRARDAGARIRWAQTELAPRIAGESRARTLRNALDNLRQIVALRRHYRRPRR